MTESEWLESEDPVAMLDGSRSPSGDLHVTGDRKVRLLACAFARSIWDRVRDARSRAAVEVSERFADGAATPADLRRAFDPAHAAWTTMDNAAGLARYCAIAGPMEWVLRTLLRPGLSGMPSPSTMASLIRDAFGNPWRPITLPMEPTPFRTRFGGGLPSPGECPWFVPDVLAVARRAYEDRQADGTLDPLTLLVLADALEDAGCDKTCDDCDGRGDGLTNGTDSPFCFPCDSTGRIPHPLLLSLRSGGPHYRGMQSLDLILGKA